MTFYMIMGMGPASSCYLKYSLTESCILQRRKINILNIYEILSMILIFITDEILTSTDLEELMVLLWN